MIKHVLAIVLETNPDVGGTNQFVREVSHKAVTVLDWKYERSDDKLWVHIFADDNPHPMKRACRELRKALGAQFSAELFTVSKDGTSLLPSRSTP